MSAPAETTCGAGGVMDQHDAFEWVLWGQIGCAAVVVLAVGIAIGFAIAKVVGR